MQVSHFRDRHVNKIQAEVFPPTPQQEVPTEQMPSAPAETGKGKKNNRGKGKTQAEDLTVVCYFLLTSHIQIQANQSQPKPSALPQQHVQLPAGNNQPDGYGNYTGSGPHPQKPMNPTASTFQQAQYHGQQYEIPIAPSMGQMGHLDYDAHYAGESSSAPTNQMQSYAGNSGHVGDSSQAYGNQIQPNAGNSGHLGNAGYVGESSSAYGMRPNAGNSGHLGNAGYPAGNSGYAGHAGYAGQSSSAHGNQLQPLSQATQQSLTSMYGNSATGPSTGSIQPSGQAARPVFGPPRPPVRITAPSNNTKQSTGPGIHSANTKQWSTGGVGATSSGTSFGATSNPSLDAAFAAIGHNSYRIPGSQASNGLLEVAQKYWAAEAAEKARKANESTTPTEPTPSVPPQATRTHRVCISFPRLINFLFTMNHR